MCTYKHQHFITIDVACYVQAKLVDGKLEFVGLIAKPDGSVMFQAKRTGVPEDAVELGKSAGEVPI